MKLTSRERFRRSLAAEPVDHVTDMEFRYWAEVPALWHAQGLQVLAGSDEEMELYFGLERRWRPPVNTILDPPFAEEDLGVRDGYRYFRDTDGVLCCVPADGGTTMPRHIEYPLRSRVDWERTFLPRLDPTSPDRVPAGLEAGVNRALADGYIPWLYVGSLAGLLRNWMGLEAFCYLCYDDPAFLDEMIGTLADVTCTVLEDALPRLRGRVDVAHFWEDIACNSGPLIPPAIFRDMMVPRYRRITGLLSRYGIDLVIVDCDGRVDELAPLWLAGGINVLFPLERAAGADPSRLRECFGPDLRLMGGIDKRQIATGGDPLVRELDRLAPLVASGGYVPFCDHFVPPDVSLAAYRFYLARKRAAFGIPARDERPRCTPAEP